MTPGDIYWADLPSGKRPAIIVSRELLNRGNYVVAVLCTTRRLAERSRFPNCVPFGAGEFGLPVDCVAQCETVLNLAKDRLDIDTGLIGSLDAERLRAIIKAIGYVIEADCEML